jgi:hypothetical protein
VNPVYRWYPTGAGGSPFHTGNTYITSILTADTTYYVSVAGDNYCEGTVRDTVKVTLICFTLRGTVFPLVHIRNQIDRLFPVTAELYEVPRLTSRDPIGTILRATPLYKTSVTYYDGTIYIPGTPKNPGRQGRSDNPGLPIDWSRIGKTSGTVNNTVVAEGEIPTVPLGMFTFFNVDPGNYVLVITRAGYIPRFTKINVAGNKILGHREIVGGDVDESLFVDGTDIGLINARNGNVLGDDRYDSKFDINGNAEIDDTDISLVKYYQGFDHEAYLDTMEWLSEY